MGEEVTAWLRAEWSQRLVEWDAGPLNIYPAGAKGLYL